MMKNPLLLLVLCIFAQYSPAQNVTGSRKKEVFKVTTLSPGTGPTQLNDPWEITYGPDGYLWVTESKGYKIYRIDPNTPNVRTTVLDLNYNSTDLTAFGADSLRVVATALPPTWNPWPQGGLAGMALHPDFTNPDSAFVYVSYVHRFLGGTSPNGIFYRNKLVRFKYNSGTGKLGSPAVLCDTLPGSKDHNSQRMIIAPETPGGQNFLFYASGDMGSGQYENRNRVIKAQNPDSYEGKILRFNLTPDADAGAAAWIPNDNPYGANSAVFCIGIRNNQGFAYDAALNILYGSSHGPYSDDEINIIERRRNYGHPMVVGYAADGNYNGNSVAGTATSLSSGVPFPTNSGNSSCPPINNEWNNKLAMDANGNGLYKDPIFSAYPAPIGTLNPPNSPATKTIGYIWRWNPANAAPASSGGGWPSEAWSGLDLYTNTVIPGWKKSLVVASIKWGRLVRLPLGATGTTTMPSNVGGSSGNVGDTISYFGSTNRFRDLAFDPNGKDIYVIMDKSPTTSGPSSSDPIIPACGGCVQKFTFLGYANNAGSSSIPDDIDITTAPAVNTVTPANTVTINADNNNLWVPITGPDGNILAEIYANGQNLGTVTSSFYQHSGATRFKGSLKYLNRSITINPSTPPSGPVKVRFYISLAEYTALAATSGSFLNGPEDLKIFKNSDANGSVMTAATTSFFPHTYQLRGANSDAYVLQSDTISSFSTFYFAGASSTLPVNLISFAGTLEPNNTVLLQWKTESEQNASHFIVERSLDGKPFVAIGKVDAKGTASAYSYADKQSADLLSASVVHYRLKIVDADATAKYSATITVSLAYITGKVSIAPNPATSEVKVTINPREEGLVNLQLSDNTGRVVLKQIHDVRRRATSNIILPLNGLAPGVYYLQVSGGGIRQLLKVQKL